MAGIDLDKIKADLNAKGYNQLDSRGDPKAWMRQQMGSLRPAMAGSEKKEEAHAVSDTAGKEEQEPAKEAPVDESQSTTEEPDVSLEETDTDEPLFEPFGLDEPEDMPSDQEPEMDGPSEDAQEMVSDADASAVPEPEPEPEKKPSEVRYERPEEPARAQPKREPTKPKAKALKPKDGSSVANSGDVLGTVQVPGFPKALMTYIRNQLPSATNNADALAAWAYAKSDKSMPVPDSIKRLSATYKGEQDVRLLQRMDATLDHISRTLLDMGKEHTNFELAVMYLVLERMNLVDDPSIEGFDVTIPGIEELRRLLHRQGLQVYRIDKDRKGRPMR